MANDESIIKFGGVIVTPTLTQTQFGSGAVFRVSHKLKAKKDHYFVGVCLGILSEKDLKDPKIKDELQKRLNSLGWYLQDEPAKPKKAKAKRAKQLP